jgi:Fe2+ transport system protein B
MTTLDPTNKAIIDIDAQASPAILAGILDIPVSMVHQGRQDGKLPSRTSASYRESIQQYIYHYKKKVSTRSTSMGEAKLAQDIRNGIAKEYLQWMEIKTLKEEVIDVAVMKELFEPVFQIIRSSLVNISRQHPETVETIDNTLESLYSLGEKIAARANEDSKYYVQTMLDKEFSVGQAEEELEEVFTPEVFND